MGKLNRNSFLIWEGAFNSAPSTLLAVDDELFYDTTVAEAIIQPLLNDTSTLGINPETLEITEQDNPLNPVEWNPVTGELKYHVEPGTGGVKTIKYTVRDNVGTLSNEATITLQPLLRETGWRGRPGTYACVSGSPGMAVFGTLESYYLDNGQTAVPLLTKANDISDPDYIAPVQDLAACPIPSASNGDLYIYNLLAGSIISKVVMTKGGATTEFFPSVTEGGFEVLQFEGGLFESIVVTVGTPTATGGPHTLRIEPSSTGGSALQEQAVADGILQEIEFLNVTLPSTTGYLGEIILIA